MKKGFTLLEVVVSCVLTSIIVLSLILILFNLKNTLDNKINISLIYEKIKYIEKTVDDVMTNNNNNNYLISNDQLYINGKLVIEFKDNTLRLFNDTAEIICEKMEFLNIFFHNNNLIKFDLSYQGIYIEKYYYIGG